MATGPGGGDKHRFDVGLEDLQTFIAVADLGSFSRAAEHLSLSQPSVSNRIRRLEEKLLVRLLDRNTRRIDLTSQGQRLYIQASATLRGLRDLLQEFNKEASARNRQVNLAATLMVSALALPPILRLFHDAHPSIPLRLFDLTPDEAVAQVVDGRCDMAVMALVEPRAGISFEPLVVDPCVVVTPLGHPLLAFAAAPLAEVLKYKVLSPDGHVGLRRAILDEAARRGLSVQLSTQARGVGSVMTLLAMAAAGLGVCIHPRSFVPTELQPTVGVVPLADCEILRTFGLVTADGRMPSPSARCFAAFLKATISAADGRWRTGREGGNL